MASRSTLPEVNPLEQLGIGSYARPLPAAEPEPREERVARRRVLPSEKPKAPPAAEEPIRVEAAVPLEKKPTERAPKREAPTAPALEAARPPKVKFNARIPGEVADQVRDCVVALYSTHGLTIDALAAEALRREVERLKRNHHGGSDFPTRQHAPKPGRPVR